MATAFDTPTNKRPRVTTGDDHDFTFLQECDFPHVAGVRFKRAVQFVNSPTTRQRLTVMAVVKEGLRFLTSRFLRCACAVQHPCKWPKLCEFVSSATSPAWLVLQYFSQLLSGRGRRLQLLFRADGKDSLESWLAAPTSRFVAQHLVRGVLTAASWTHCRHARVFA